VDAAIELADAHGIDGLSMRKLASHLGAGAMSLYNHVANKDDLLDAMVDRVAGQPALPDRSQGWQAAARQFAVETHQALLRHPWAITMWQTRWPGPNRWLYMETLLAILADADFTEDHADLAFHAITMHIQGFTQQQVSYTTQFADGDALYARFAAEVKAGSFPHLIDHVRYHNDGGTTQDEFAFVLDLILDGLERKGR